jgi:hypothetical protein
MASVGQMASWDPTLGYGTVSRAPYLPSLLFLLWVN